MQIRPTLLIFDIDGTLLRTGPCGKLAFEEAFKELFEISDSWKDIQVDGRTDPLIFDEIALRELGRSLTQDESETLLNKYSDHFPKYLTQSKQFRLMPNIKFLIEKLSSLDHIHLSIGTGNIEKTARLKLERGHLNDFFQTGGFASDSAIRKEIIHKAYLQSVEIYKIDFSCDRIFVIGDTKHDVKAAHDLGYKSIGVCTGGNKGSDFKEFPPNYLFEDLSDPNAFLEAIMS